MSRQHLQITLQTRPFRNRYCAIVAFPHTAMRAKDGQATTRTEAIAGALLCKDISFASKAVGAAIEDAERDGVSVALILQGTTLRLPRRH